LDASGQVLGDGFEAKSPFELLDRNFARLSHCTLTHQLSADFAASTARGLMVGAARSPSESGGFWGNCYLF